MKIKVHHFYSVAELYDLDWSEFFIDIEHILDYRKLDGMTEIIINSGKGNSVRYVKENPKEITALINQAKYDEKLQKVINAED